MKYFTTPNSKNIIATLHIVTIGKSELAFLIILYFYGQTQSLSNFFFFFCKGKHIVLELDSDSYA